jgi:hypothetical protein
MLQHSTVRNKGPTAPPTATTLNATAKTPTTATAPEEGKFQE